MMTKYVVTWCVFLVSKNITEHETYVRCLAVYFLVNVITNGLQELIFM